MTQDRLELVVQRRWLETPEVLALELASADGSALPPFTAGAHLEVHTPAGAIRQYSLCNDPAQRMRYQIAVLRDPQSRGGSTSLHAAAAEGDRLQVSVPRNLFPLVEHAAHSVLLAGGIGVTPLIAMAHTLHRQGTSFELHYCGRGEDAMAFLQNLRAAPFADRVHVHAQGRADFDLQALLRQCIGGTQVYVCGPAGFMAHAFDAARAVGLPDAFLHAERFGAEVGTQPAGAFEIEIFSTGEVLTIPADRSAADVLSEHGHFIPISCEQGVCGSCVTGILSGTPEHRDTILDADQKAANDCFTPCCSRALSARLVLAL